METGELILVVLIIQLIAIAGAMLFARVSSLVGNRNAIIIQIVIWMIICLLAYFTASKLMFYFTAGLVGMVLGDPGLVKGYLFQAVATPECRK